MQKKILLALGDSWTVGAELNPDIIPMGFNLRVPYVNLLKEQLNFDQFYNYGISGSSLEDLLYQFQKFIATDWNKNDAVTVVVHLTNPWRTAHLPRGVSLDANSNERKHWPFDAKQFIKDFVLHFHTQEHTIMRASASISALQYWCQQYNFNDYYFSGWIKYPTWLPGVNVDKIWANGNETAADWFGALSHNGEHLINVETNPYIVPNFSHPNQRGHRLIADKLAAWICPTP